MRSFFDYEVVKKQNLPSLFDHLGEKKQNLPSLFDHLGEKKQNFPSLFDHLGEKKQNFPSLFDHLGAFWSSFGQGKDKMMGVKSWFRVFWVFRSPSISSFHQTSAFQPLLRHP